jgi:23S rRNA pseudouridine1911/1915/1917 synthase
MKNNKTDSYDNNADQHLSSNKTKDEAANSLLINNISTEDFDDDLDFMEVNQNICDAEDEGAAINQERILYFIVNDDNNGIRIDKYLTLVQADISRSFIQRLVESGNITVDGNPIKVSYKVKAGNKVTVNIPAPKEALIEPENIPLDIIYEDQDIIIINKPKGLVVHPAAGHASGTLVNALLYHCKGELSGINGVMRPGIVHRIDRDTTGVIVACKNDKAHQFIADQLKIHSITRRYQAIVYNIFKTDSGRVEAPIGRDPKDRKKMSINYKNGKPAATNYKVLENLNAQHSYIECSLETGRTHQIRVHMASIHHPLVGDTVYGPGKDPFHLEGQALHAGVLGFIHPTTKEYVEFIAPLPEYFTNLLEKLRYKR